MRRAIGLANLDVALRDLGAVIERARRDVPAGRLADHLEHLEDVRCDMLAEVQVQAAPAPTTNLGSLLRERARYAKGGRR